MDQHLVEKSVKELNTSMLEILSCIYEKLYKPNAKVFDHQCEMLFFPIALVIMFLFLTLPRISPYLLKTMCSFPSLVNQSK